MCDHSVRTLRRAQAKRTHDSLSSACISSFDFLCLKSHHASKPAKLLSALIRTRCSCHASGALYRAYKPAVNGIKKSTLVADCGRVRHVSGPWFLTLVRGGFCRMVELDKLVQRSEALKRLRSLFDMHRVAFGSSGNLADVL